MQNDVEVLVHPVASHVVCEGARATAWKHERVSQPVVDGLGFANRWWTGRGGWSMFHESGAGATAGGG